MIATQRLGMSKPDKIGKYPISSVLGSGSMGVVYKGFDPFIKRPVAIKTIHPSLVDSELSDELLSRFATEAEAVGRLTHPNIVSIFDYEEIEGVPYFVMEYVEGVELKSILRQRTPLSLFDAATIVHKVLEGLAYVHHLGIVHRDIKPANIFILNDGGVKIADFGIARLDDSDYTQMGRVLGTPSYMSPEQCKGAVLDHRSDLFSLALIFFEMVTGRKAFEGSTAQETMHKVVHDVFALPRDLPLDLPKSLQGFFAKALAKCPEARFQSAAEFKAALIRLSSVEAEERLEIKKSGILQRWLVTFGSVVGLLSLIGILVVQTMDVLDPSGRDADVSGQENKEAANTVISTIGARSEPKKNLTPAEKAKVERLLQVAKTHLLVQRLVAPQGSNAYDAFHLVLEIDPNNLDAFSGLDIVEEKLLERVVVLQHEGKVAEFNSFVALGEKLFPNSQRWVTLK